MGFRDCDFKFYYNTDEDDIVNDFYCKALGESKLYKRAAGFFSSSSLPVIAKGIEKLLENEGKMQLLISPKLSKKDIEAIKKGYTSKEKLISDSLLREFMRGFVTQESRYNYLAWLIYEKRLDIKVVVRKDFSNFGMFHEKFGILYDDEDKVAFHGSVNESETGYLDNHESIEVFLSWEDRDMARVVNNEAIFDRIWNSKSTNWETYEFPEAIKKELLSIRSKNRPIERYSNYKRNKSIIIPYNLRLRAYQKEAVNLWFENNCRGIFEMATGTGKTFTATIAMAQLIKHLNLKSISCSILIVVPYKVLLEQWVEVLKDFNIEPIRCYESKSSWLEKLANAVMLINQSAINNIFIITTNTTFNKKEFQDQLQVINKHLLLCVDEVHHMATENAIFKLPDKATFRLGLSATLMSKYENENLSRLKEYFGGTVFSYPMEAAIKGKFLTPYKYYPIFVEMTDEEQEEYYLISERISKIAAMNKDIMEDNIALKSLLIKRARILASSENKLHKLRSLQNVIKDTSHNIFYCGDKKESDSRYIEKVNKVLAHEIGIKTHTFTSHEDKNTRADLLQKFTDGKIQALTAIRCLDEGVDIPSLRRAFILSSGTNPKEFIQRRGRILRISEGKDIAEIYDFIVIPTLSGFEKNSKQFEQQILRREYERFKEFASLALNKQEALAKIIEIWSSCN